MTRARAAREEAVRTRRVLRHVEHRRRMPSRLASVALPLAGTLALGAVVLIMIGNDDTPAVADPVNPDLRALTSAPQRYAGQEVTITATVEERYGGRAFALGRPDSAPDVIVLLDRDMRRRLDGPPRGAVTVTGEARVVGDDLLGVLGGDYAVRRGGPAIAAARIAARG